MNTNRQLEILLLDLQQIQYEQMQACSFMRKWFSTPVLVNVVSMLEDEAKQFQWELRNCLHSLSSDPADQAQCKSKVYEQWGGIQKIKPGCSEYELLVSCEENERAIVLLYEQVLSDREYFPREVCWIISTQLKKMGKSLTLIIETKLYAAAVQPKSIQGVRPCME